MTALARALIDLGAIAHNTDLLSRAAPGAELMAIVKADGFGHGAAEVARTALTSGASWLGVTSTTEALALRAGGVTAPMLMWLYAPGDELDEALLAGVDVSVSSTEALESIAEAAQHTGRVADIHLKVDTGMSRGGATAREWHHLLRQAAKTQRAGCVRIHGLWSHLARAEDPSDPGLRRQLRAFAEARRVAAAAGVHVPWTHLANSAALAQLPETHFDLVRAGVALYGVEPVPGRRLGLRAAMTLEATVVLTKRVPAGTGVSYGPDFVTDRETTLALVPVGFADGIPRLASGRAALSIHGVRCPIAGRVAMDQVVADVGDLPVRAGDTAVLFGPGTRGEPTVEQWAQWAATNPHEIMTGVGPRVVRQYREHSFTGADKDRQSAVMHGGRR